MQKRSCLWSVFLAALLFFSGSALVYANEIWLYRELTQKDIDAYCAIAKLGKRLALENITDEDHPEFASLKAEYERLFAESGWLDVPESRKVDMKLRMIYAVLLLTESYTEFKAYCIANGIPVSTTAEVELVRQNAEQLDRLF